MYPRLKGVFPQYILPLVLLSSKFNIMGNFVKLNSASRSCHFYITQNLRAYVCMKAKQAQVVINRYVYLIRE